MSDLCLGLSGEWLHKFLHRVVICWTNSLSVWFNGRKKCGSWITMVNVLVFISFFYIGWNWIYGWIFVWLKFVPSSCGQLNNYRTGILVRMVCMGWIIVEICYIICIIFLAFLKWSWKEIEFINFLCSSAWLCKIQRCKWKLSIVWFKNKNIVA